MRIERVSPYHRFGEPLTREERRLLARSPHRRRCLYCLGPLANGRAVCSDACDDGWWAIVPTLSGELWT
jgi:hypothetical protein